MNRIDADYQNLLKDILQNGTKKTDRTGTGTLSVFGRQIRHKMSDGFPLLTTKKMAYKSMIVELLWFLQGRTDLRYLLQNNCNIWTGDAYKNYEKKVHFSSNPYDRKILSVESIEGIEGFSNFEIGDIFNKEEFIEKIKTDDVFAEKWGELGKIYGYQWRNWSNYRQVDFDKYEKDKSIDQIQNLINDLKTNPDSRRLLVTAWNPSDLPYQILPPCHYGFQCYTRELTYEERYKLLIEKWYENADISEAELTKEVIETDFIKYNVPTRGLSLQWNQRSVDTFLGLPFNIASYGLLLEILAKIVNMLPDELIGNLGDTHLYSNHIEQAEEQISRSSFNLPQLKFSDKFLTTVDKYNGVYKSKYGQDFGYLNVLDNLISSLDVSDFIIEDYKSHPTIKAPLSN